MRLFFALWPDDETRNQLHQAVSGAVTRVGGRAVPAANFHLTLAFLGSVEPSRLEAIVAAAGSVATAAYDLVLDQFGGSSGARVVWLEPGRFPVDLLELYDRLWRQMETVGFQRERRSFRPHVTLCRKTRPWTHGEGPGKGPALITDPVRWRSKGFVLAESATTPEGARYRVVERFPGLA